MSTDVTSDDGCRAIRATGIGPDGLPPRRSVAGRLYHGETSIDFYGRRWWGLGLSIVLILITVLSLGINGLNLGIDFEGGVSWEVPSADVHRRPGAHGAGEQRASAPTTSRSSSARRPPGATC